MRSSCPDSVLSFGRDFIASKRTDQSAGKQDLKGEPVTTGYACSVCGTPVTDLGATSCSTCRVDFSKIGPAPARAAEPSPTGNALAAQTGWQVPPEHDPSWSKRPWLRRHWRFALFLGFIGSIVAVYAFLFSIVFQMAAVPTQRINSDLSEASGGEILSILPVPGLVTGGRLHFELFLADNVSPTEAARLACQVVPGILAHDGYAGTPFTLARLGASQIAASTTPCH